MTIDKFPNKYKHTVLNLIINSKAQLLIINKTYTEMHPQVKNYKFTT